MNIHELTQQLHQQTPLVIAIDGPSGSGKSTIASHFETTYNCLVFHTDDYFLPANRKTKDRLQEPGGNLDYERMLQEVFMNIKEDKIPSHYFNCQTEQLELRPLYTKKPIIIVEGVYSMHPVFVPYYDITIYLDIDRPNQLQRILDRSNLKILERFKKEWIPLEDLYFETFDIKNSADIVLSTSLNIDELLTSL